MCFLQVCFWFKLKTAYEWRISDCSSYVCSSDLKMMTVVAIMAGLLPIMWSSGTDSEVMRRIAAPMVGGMVSSTVLTLVVIPALYSLVKQRQLARRPPTPVALPAEEIGRASCRERVG